jgi:UDP-N-acetylglucosamine 2-epimerase (non-hydrolysing)
MSNIMVVVGTRPETIKLWPVVEALQRRGMDVEVCSTGQHDSLLDQALVSTGLRVDHRISVDRKTDCISEFMSRLLPRLAALLADRNPRWTVVQGDTTSALTAAIAAHHLRLPVAHVEAGLRIGSNREPWPEEFNRKAISAIAELHFAPTDACARHLRAEGYDAERIVVTGNTVVDALREMQKRLSEGCMKGTDVNAVLARVASRRLILLTAHRRENLGAGLTGIASAAKQIAQRDDVHIAVSMHPNPEASTPLREALEGETAVSLLPAITYDSMVRLMLCADLIMTDSGGMQEEAAALNKPVLVLRDRTERTEAVQAGLAQLVGTDPALIIKTTCAALDRSTSWVAVKDCSSIHGDGKAGDRIARSLIESALGSTLPKRHDPTTPT